MPAKSQAEQSFHCSLTTHLVLGATSQESVGSDGEERVGSRIALGKVSRGGDKSTSGRREAGKQDARG